MLLYLQVIILCVVRPANIKDCFSTNCVVLDDTDIATLLNQSILNQYQIEHLHKHYYHKSNIIDLDLEIEDNSTPAQATTKPPDDTQHDTIDAELNANDLDESITAYNVVTTFMSTANLLYTCGCLILTIAYVVLIFWFRNDSPYIQIALTFIYHYIYHIIADLLSHTISSRILAAILYVCCCNMPTISLFIYLFHPKLLNGYGLLQQTYNAVKEFVENTNNGTAITTDRWDIYFINMIPNKIFIYVILLCLTSMITPFIYTFQFKTEFIGILGVFTATLYTLLMILAFFSLKSDKINNLFRLISKSCEYGDCRCIYLSIIYWIFMFITAYKYNHNTILCTVCLISGLNAYFWSFPLFLFIDIFKPQINIQWRTITDSNNNNIFVEYSNVILHLLQQDSDRYIAFIVTNITINWFLLQLCIYYSSWIAVPYCVISLFCLSFTIKTDMKQSILIHIPIAYSLLKACFAYIYIIDIDTLQSLSWIAPSNVLFWIITTSLRVGTSLVASLQVTRSIYWLTLPPSQWELPVTKIMDIFIHCVTLYVIGNVFLYFTFLEPNAFISFLFEMFGISSGCTLIVSIGIILASKNRPWVFFIVNMVMNLRFYVLSYALLIPRILTFLASLASFTLLFDDKNKDKRIVDMHLNRNIDITIAVVLAIIFYSGFGLSYDCKLLIFTAIVVLCVYVSFKVWQKTNSKRATLVVLSILAVILIQVGLRFETMFGIGLSSVDNFADKTILSFINYYFRNIFFQL